MRRTVLVTKTVGLLLLVTVAVGHAQTGCWNCSASWIVGPPGPAAKREIPKGQVSCPVDDKGVFRCTLPSAPLDVAFRAAGFVPRYRWGLAPRPGKVLEVGVVELKKGASLKGWVEVEGGPIANGQCVARLFPIVSTGGGDPALVERLRRAAAESPVGADGFFQLSGIAPGSYQVEVEQPGYAPARVFPVDVWPGAETALKQCIDNYVDKDELHAATYNRTHQ